MGLQLIGRKRSAFEVDDQRRVAAAVEGELDPPFQIALQDHGRSALDRRTAGLPDHDRVFLRRYLAEPQSTDRLGRAARGAQVPQQALLAAEKSFTQKGDAE